MSRMSNILVFGLYSLQELAGQFHTLLTTVMPFHQTGHHTLGTGHLVQDMTCFQPLLPQDQEWEGESTEDLIWVIFQ